MASNSSKSHGSNTESCKSSFDKLDAAKATRRELESEVMSHEKLLKQRELEESQCKIFISSYQVKIEAEKKLQETVMKNLHKGLLSAEENYSKVVTLLVEAQCQAALIRRKLLATTKQIECIESICVNESLGLTTGSSIHQFQLDDEGQDDVKVSPSTTHRHEALSTGAGPSAVPSATSTPRGLLGLML